MNNEGITPEQQIELAQAERDNAQAQAELLKLRKESEQLEEMRRDAVARQTLKDAILESGVKFYLISDATTLAQNYDLRFDDKGQGTGVVDGKRVPLVDVIKDIALKNPTLADGRTLRSLKTPDEAADRKPRCKAELRSVREKSDAIEKWGLEWYERLPLNLPVQKHVSELTLKEYSHLPISEKTRLLAENPRILEELARRNRNT